MSQNLSNLPSQEIQIEGLEDWRAYEVNFFSTQPGGSPSIPAPQLEVSAGGILVVPITFELFGCHDNNSDWAFTVKPSGAGNRFANHNDIPTLKPINNFSFSIYPNPAESAYSIYLPSLKNNETFDCYMYDAAGRLLIKNSELNKNFTTFDVSDFQRGIYFVKINYKGESVYKKLILN